MRITASAPGKLVLLGEYAVLEGAPALVLAVNHRARATLTPPTDNLWEVVSPTLGLRAPLRLDAGAAAFEGAAPPALAWVGALLAAWPHAADPPACRIILDSDPFYLDHAGTRVKLGLGSSAALTVALLGALHALAGKSTPTLRECIGAHRGIQHGRGSGIDIAASLTGGLSRFQLVAGDARVAPARLPDGLCMTCIYSGRPASTSAMLAAVATYAAHAPAAYAQHMHGLATISSRGIDAMTANDAAAFLSSLHAYALALADFGRAAGVDIASREHRALGALATDCGCTYKSCGAGGGDVGVTFSVDNRRLQAFAVRAARAGFASVELQADANGLIVAANV